MTEPLVLIPGLSCDARLFAPQWPALAPGRPILVAQHDRDESLTAIAGRLLAVAPERFALCGLSMGGYIAFEVMRQAPQRVTRLALLDTSARPPTPETNAPREQMIALAQKGAFDNVTTLIWQKLVAPARLADEPLRLLARDMAETVGAEGFVRQQRAIMSRPDSRPGLAAIRVPTLVLVGEEDLITPPAEAELITAGIGASARRVTIPGCGHLSTLERPDAVTRELLAWLG
ncbi:alpha/beta fold hydrolase [Bosea sp. (in: a-proteobacteria)]|uniref:alpha/beta fold hydrolase n=1 Tax=Bosea sp. (in: a-proteobacteria) TaxID=1871050 RepID=UPI0027352743|nr:alpha/beta fold hydrolase [Bosea sp. (in: a-proteobacteria)]MDP3408150.1 alpha/beta fold hydrolase [Bosea sp. (in: a-proteobacteria)]